MLKKLNITAIANIEHKHVINFFATQQHKPWACLLDSCEQYELGARFDILASDPDITYQFIEGQHVLGGDQQSHFYLSAETCPFAQLANIHKQFCAQIDSTTFKGSDYQDIPFLIGALGAFGYDINIHTDSIANNKPNQYKMADINIGFYSTAFVYDNLTKTIYICSLCEAKSQCYENAIEAIITADASSKSSKAVSDFNLTSQWLSNVTEQQYTQQFERIEEYLRAGDCYQVNFAQRFKASYEGCEFDAYKRLRTVNKSPFSAFMRLPDSCLLSVSPERFLLVKNQQVESKPIKGTRKRGIDQQHDQLLATELLASEKDRAENLMIVDLLRNDLSKHCRPHSVKVPKLFALESYPAVHHMVSTVVGELKPQASVYDLLKGAFPGGSITGAPKVRAMQIIQELEPDKRAIYCGSIGYIGIRNDMDTNICIRTLLAENNTLYCWAGGGIVIDSQAQDEYQESLHKVAKILPTLSKEIKYD